MGGRAHPLQIPLSLCVYCFAVDRLFAEDGLFPIPARDLGSIFGCGGV